MSPVKVYPEKCKYVYQSVVVFGATLLEVAAVLSYAWASPSLPLLLEPGGPVRITVEQGTWIVAGTKLGMIVAPIPAAWMMDSWGHKPTMLVGAVPLLASWIMMAYAETFELIVVFTFVGGAALSYSSVVLPVYIAEISSPHIRGYLGVLFTVMCKVGLLLMYAIGPFVSIRMTAWLCTIPVGLFVAVYVWLPESPYHLLAIGQHGQAEQCIQKLRCNLDVKEELAQMAASVKESQANPGTFRELFLNPRNRRNIIVVMGLAALVDLSGSQIVGSYAQTIFATLDTDLMEPEYASIVFGVAQLVAAVLACFLVDTLGRRPLLLISIVGSGACTMAVGVYYVLERHMDVTGLGWLPLTAIMLFMVTYTVGMLSLLYVLTSELFPKHLRSVAAATKAITGNLIGLGMVYGYQYGVDEWGYDYVFVTFSVLTFVFVPFVIYLVPETKRKSLDRILIDGNKK